MNPRKHFLFLIATALILAAVPASAQNTAIARQELDLNGIRMSSVWEKRFAAELLHPAIDANSDGHPDTDASITDTTTSMADASRFLAQATLGADWEMISSVASTGYASWIDSQFNLPLGSYLNKNLALQRPSLENPAEEVVSPYSWTWWDEVIRSPDVLRQRIAFALSEIFVINEQSFSDNPWGPADYYDILLRGAFGNYQTILQEVAMHACMGSYLGHARNRRTNLAINRFPDENFAREIMQLFSIGLFELNIDGTRTKDASGNDIPTYDNSTITEFAKIFTGLTYDPSMNTTEIPIQDDDLGITEITSESDFINVEAVFLATPLIPYEPMHEPGNKTLLRGNNARVDAPGVVVNTGTTVGDVTAAVNNLFVHPNVGPFIAYRLIQRLVKSNPSPAYTARVARAFNNNGNGVRGDMRAVIRAILLDPEARNRGYLNDPTHGMLREPLIRHVHLVRTFNFTSKSGFFRVVSEDGAEAMNQSPLQSPTVFNFFLTDHQPFGPIKNANLVAPEFQVTTATTSIATMNFWSDIIHSGVFVEFDGEHPDTGSADLVDEIALAYNIPALVDRLDILLTQGALTPAARTIMVNTLTSTRTVVSNDTEFVRFAIYLFVNSPDFAVLR